METLWGKMGQGGWGHVRRESVLKRKCYRKGSSVGNVEMERSTNCPYYMRQVLTTLPTYGNYHSNVLSSSSTSGTLLTLMSAGLASGPVHSPIRTYACEARQGKRYHHGGEHNDSLHRVRECVMPSLWHDGKCCAHKLQTCLPAHSAVPCGAAD
jgi:hypothetical protein